MKSKKELINQLCQVFQRQGTLTVLHTHAVATKIGLSATEFECLDTISRNQPIMAGQLATMCGLTTGAITGIIDRLEKAGFVERAVSQEDRRCVFLRPIERLETNRKVAALYGPMSHAFEQVVADCTIDQLRFLVDSHSRMNDAAQDIIVEMNKK